MSHEWKPGDVATARVTSRGPERRRIQWTGDGDPGRPWLVLDELGGHVASCVVAEIEPASLVTIDADDREQVERLTYVLMHHFWSEKYQTHTDAIQAGLREFLEPPKPEEPTGLGAVVEANFEDDEGKGFGRAHWVKAGDGSWVCLTDGHVGHAVPWPFLRNVEVTP